jgi:opacity protein-like surface antigen
MNNVGTSDLDNRATTIANFLGGTASTAYIANEVAFGIRYKFVVSPKVHPYVLGALGFAHVNTESVFTVNGSVVDPASQGVQLGADLSGSTNRGIFVIGFGVNVPFKERFFGDVGYRFGEIFSKTVADGESLPSIPTQRIMFGVGMKF